MTTKTLSRWQQDDEGDGGVMTFCFQNGDVSCWFRSFTVAHQLQQAIQQELREVRYDARAGLINQIARIDPGA